LNPNNTLIAYQVYNGTLKEDKLKRPTNLHDSLEARLRQEIFDGLNMWDCDRCNTKTPAEMSHKLETLPPYLIIHFNRFKKQGTKTYKISSRLQYPLKNLDLSEFSGDPSHIYDLAGVVNHYGTLQRGHYIAYA
jgi:ubiquitin C-terminal hydrolase